MGRVPFFLLCCLLLYKHLCVFACLFWWGLVCSVSIFRCYHQRYILLTQSVDFSHFCNSFLSYNISKVIVFSVVHAAAAGVGGGGEVGGGGRYRYGDSQKT